MTQTWPFRETWEEGDQEDGESGLGEFAPYQAEKSTMSKRQELTESRRGSIYNLVSLNWYNLYCEAFEMSCDLVTFPFFGAFAPCSDKQLKKHTNIKHSAGQGPADRREVKTLSSAVEWGVGMGGGTKGRAGQEWLQAPPGMLWDGIFWLEVLP